MATAVSEAPSTASTTPAKTGTGTELAKKANETGSKKRRRPARVQAERYTGYEEHQGVYNIWYHKYCGDRDFKKVRRETKIDVEKDIGYTRGDRNPQAYICLYFARGACSNGKNCTYLHRIPTDADQERIDMLRDCFGRERHGTDRDDMGGTGNFNRECRTIYVGGLRRLPGLNLEEKLREEFDRYGEITNLRLVEARSLAFITYKNRVNAEFAKEAMSDQSLGHNELLNVRWAYDNPNDDKTEENKAIAAKVVDATYQEADKKYFNAYGQEAPSYTIPMLPSDAYPDTNKQYDAYKQYSQVHNYGQQVAYNAEAGQAQSAVDYYSIPPEHRAMFYGDQDGSSSSSSTTAAGSSASAWTPEQLQAYYAQYGYDYSAYYASATASASAPASSSSSTPPSTTTSSSK